MRDLSDLGLSFKGAKYDEVVAAIEVLIKHQAFLYSLMLVQTHLASSEKEENLDFNSFLKGANFSLRVLSELPTALDASKKVF